MPPEMLSVRQKIPLDKTQGNWESQKDNDEAFLAAKALANTAHKRYNLYITKRFFSILTDAIAIYHIPVKERA